MKPAIYKVSEEPDALPEAPSSRASLTDSIVSRFLTLRDQTLISILLDWTLICVFIPNNRYS